MNHLIVYCSSHGTTTKAALFLKQQLDGEVVLLNLNRSTLQSDLAIFDSVIIGGSIHIGKIQGKIKKFINQNRATLLTKKVGLFLCCMRDGETAQTQFENAFPKELREHAVAKGIFGGEFLFSNMNFLEKQMVQKVARVSSDQSTLDEKAMKDFVATFNKQEAPTILQNKKEKS